MMPPPRDIGLRRGFHGKIPSRGDFVSVGLKRAFTTRWDEWVADVFVQSRATLDRDWLPAWLEAPVWRFVLAEGLCGPDAALGLWMPSVDRVGRYYPLLLAVTCEADSDRLMGEACWLETAERAGWSAVQETLSPEELAERLANGQQDEAAGVGLDEVRVATGCGVWWTAGAPRVRPARYCMRGLPCAGTFATMLVDPATPQAGLT